MNDKNRIQKIKKGTAVLLCIVAAMTLFSGCFSSEEVTESSSSEIQLEKKKPEKSGKKAAADNKSDVKTEKQDTSEKNDKEENADNKKTENALYTDKEQINEAPAGNSAGSPHTHTWIPHTAVVHHEAVTKQVWVEDTPAYDENIYSEIPVYETIEKVRCACGEDFDTYGAWQFHLNLDNSADYFIKHGAYGVVWEQVQTGTQSEISGTIHHEATGHYETVTVSEAWDETVVSGYTCSACGAAK